MAVNWTLPVRGLQTVLAVAVLGLMAYVSSWWSTHWRQFSPTEVNFMIFAPVWTIVALAVLLILPWKLPRIANAGVPRMGLVALEIITMLYWFGGFIALAVFLSNRICFGTVCNVAKAGTAISAFQWVAFAVTTASTVTGLFKSKRSGASMGEPKVEMHQGV